MTNITNKKFEKIYETLINPEQYYNIYREIKGILSIIEYLHLDKDAGL